jgi:hypothetical protein
MYTSRGKALSVAIRGGEHSRSLKVAVQDLVFMAHPLYHLIHTSVDCRWTVVLDIAGHYVLNLLLKEVEWRKWGVWSLRSFERSSIYSYFDKLLEVSTFGVRDIRTWDISKVLGALSVRHVRLQSFTVLTLFGLLCVPGRLIKEAMRADGLWWTGWSCKVYKCIVNTFLRMRDVKV